jgi:hypothetical protein
VDVPHQLLRLVIAGYETATRIVWFLVLYALYDLDWKKT